MAYICLSEKNFLCEKIMKILLVNNFYYNRGGDCTYLFALKTILKEHQNQVSIFSMNHPQNFQTDFSKYFVSYINYEEEVKSKTISSGFKVAKRTIYSTEAKRKIEELIRNERPDVAHIQNIHHHITPSIFKCLKDHNIPIIWTLHDYTVICPNTSFLADGEICEKCKKKKYFWPSIVKCKKKSFAASTMAALEASVHAMMKFYDYVDFFIAPSEFMRDKLQEYGIRPEKIVHLNNFTCFADIDIDIENKSEEKYFMYLGRLADEKGIRTLIDASIKAFADPESSNGIINNYKLKIIGDGPIKRREMSYVKSKGAGNIIQFLGHKSHDEAMQLLKGSEFLIIPSEWYENFPYAVLEAFSMRKPVIASRIGGITELVKNWKTGLLFEPGNSDMLSMKINFLLKHPEKSRDLGTNAKAFMAGDINPENHYLKLMEVYNRAISMKNSKKGSEI